MESESLPNFVSASQVTTTTASSASASTNSTHDHPSGCFKILSRVNGNLDMLVF
jgi:hypothetical protein